MKKLTNQEIAQNVIDVANQLKWNIKVRGCILTITKEIIKNDLDDFCKADSQYYRILGLVPQTRPGSTWGTDGGGVGAISATKSGLFVMKKSGCNKNILKAIAKLQGLKYES